MKRLLFAFMAVLLSSAVFAQETVDVKGTVLDENGWPLTGAYVLVQGTSIGTLTDLDGNFEITAPKDGLLEFTFMGYLTQTLAPQSQMNVTLQPDALMMEEVVVVGYGTQKSKDLTAPIVNVKGDELSKQITASPMSALQGKVAGVQVVNSGVPGAGPSVKVRGMGSIGDYANPLYIVDGVFVENLDFVSTADIQEMTVLKDASASAIYGVRAANGVIIITTKKGVMDHTDISYDGYVGLQVPVNVMKLADKDQYVELLNEANASVAGYVPKDPKAYNTSTDWYRTLLRNAVTHSHALNISGATAKTNYSLGLNYFNQEGVMKSDNSYDRLNFRARLDQKVTDWLDMGVNTLVSRFNTVSPDTGAYFQAFVNPPVYGIYNDANTDAYPVKYDSPQLYGFGNSYGNPYARAQYNDSKSQGLNLVFSAYAELKFIENKLKFRTSFNMDYQAYQARNYQLEYFVGGSQGLTTSTMNKTYGIRDKYIVDNTLTYTDNIGAHSFSAMLGQSTRVEKFSGMTGSGVGVPGDTEEGMYIGNGSASDRFVNDKDPGPYRFHGLSFFARGTYNYADKYLASLTFRADGSSKYQQKWGFFPSVGLGWVITEEDFMQEQNAFEYLKFRASWGLLGNDSVPANSTAIVGASGTGASGVFGDAIVDGVGAQTVYQNYLKWEVVNEFDAGFDFAFLSNRLTGNIDYYNRTTSNVVFYAPIASGGGVADLLANNGKVRNQGVELTLGWADTVGEDFSYNIGFNLTTIANKVVELKGREYIPGASVRNNYTTRTMEGYPIGTFWGYEIDRVYQDEKEARLDKQDQPAKSQGYFRYKDQNNDGKIDENDEVSLGSPIPKVTAGLDFGFNWKNLDFSISFYGQFGNKVLNAKRMNRDVFPDANYDLDFYENCWRPDRPSSTYPSAAAYNSSATQRANDFFVEDAWYLRIQNVQVGYTFKNLGKKDIVKSLRVYLAAQRPYT
ncbi:MAG: TonB-dependent receptor, partial [Bacteroidales bacterium]|nr:TonB-dependent receptor [Bacteroidales bacterium]